jgi:hypothetical protein
MRLIDAKGMEGGIKEAFKENPFLMGMLLRWVRKHPTIDAVPVVHGRWVYRKSWDKLVCSNCSLESDRSWNYCPNCGARMDGEG